jgi:hypothetical protein
MTRSMATIGTLIAVLILAALLSTGVLERQLREPFAAVPPDPANQALCEDVLKDLTQPDAAGNRSFKTLKTDDLTRLQSLWQVCKLREEVEDLNRKYRENQSLLGRLGTISGLLFTFATGLA